MARPKKKVRVGKREIDQDVAAKFDHPLLDTEDMTATFLLGITRHLLDGKEVHLPNFGTFHLVVRKGRALANLTQGNFKKGQTEGKHIVDVRRKFYVVFRKSVPLRDAIRQRFGKEKVVDSGEIRRRRVGK